MKTKFGLVLLALLLIPMLSVVTVLPAQASFSENDGVTGFVTQNGAPAEGLTVTVTRITDIDSPPFPEVYTTTTDSAGFFSVLHVFAHGNTYRVDIATPIGTLSQNVVCWCGVVACADFCYGAYGYTPGWWKNRALTLGIWPAPYTPTTSLQSVFGSNAPAGTFLAGLQMQGGSGVAGAKQILARAAVAALLNAASSGDYPLTETQVIDQVTDAFDSNSRPTMIGLAGTLDGYNNIIG